MTVWQLLRAVVVHVLHGRGRDQVYLSLDTACAHITQHDWLLDDVSWTDGRDRYVVLEGTPEVA
jgi:hypothetical protein